MHDGVATLSPPKQDNAVQRRYWTRRTVFVYHPSDMGASTRPHSFTFWERRRPAGSLVTTDSLPPADETSALPGLAIRFSPNIVVGGDKNAPGPHLRHQTFWLLGGFWFINGMS